VAAGVEPRGFEPLTSAVQRRHNSLLEVAGGCKIPANTLILYVNSFPDISGDLLGLLHRRYGLHPHEVRDDCYSTSHLEATSARFVLGVFCDLHSTLFMRSSRASFVL
jgi:hypothetical protein